MFKIGEFSQLTQVSIRMLRYYDEVGLLKPTEINPFSGYRIYSVNQIPILHRIIYLRDSGFNVSEIAKALKTDDNLLLEQLDLKRSEIEKTIQAEQDKLNKIELAKQEILHGKSELRYNFTVKSIPSYNVLSLRKTIPNYYAEGELWKELSAFAADHQIKLSNNTFTIYYDTECKETDVDVELCVPVKTMGENIGNFIYRITEPIPIMACTMVYGKFSNISGAYSDFAEWLQNNSQYKMSRPIRQIVHRGPWNEKDPEKYLIELQIPLEIT